MKRILMTWFIPLWLCIISIAFIQPGNAYSGIQEIKVSGVGEKADDRFGHAVSVWDQYAIIGAYNDDAYGRDAGAAMIVRYNGEIWSEYAVLSSSSPIPSGHFGFSVSMWDEYAAAGAPNDDGGSLYSGAVSIFKLNALNNWTQQDRVFATDGAQNDEFGSSVSLHQDRLIVGAKRHNTGGRKDAGAAYIFVNRGGNWMEQPAAEISANDAAASDHFGNAVAIYGDYAVVGAVHESASGLDAGAAYIFRYSGDSWIQLQKLLPPADASGDFFGFAVAVSNSYAAVGAPADDDGGENAGAVYLYRKSSPNAWAYMTKLTPASGGPRQYFGRSVSITDSHLAVGADGNDDRGENAGAVFLYRNSGGTWQMLSKYTATDGGPEDRFGWPVSVYSPDASSFYLLAGAEKDDDRGENSGSAYLIGDFPIGYPQISVNPTAISMSSCDFPHMSPGLGTARTNEEMICTTGLEIPERVKEYWTKRVSPPGIPNLGTLPDQVDWSEYDSPVKSQGYCQACSTFAVLGLIENIINQMGFIKNPDLSEQAIIACSEEVGCSSGSWFYSTFEYIKKFGVEPEGCYPYEGNEGNCSYKCPDPEYVISVADFTSENGLWDENHSVDGLRQALQNGPLVVTMRVPNDNTFRNSGYKGGIYNYEGGFIDWMGNGHAVLLVGYNDIEDYFLVKNSWGPNWGENGYFRIAYDDVTDDVEFGGYASTVSGVFQKDSSAYFDIKNTGTADLEISAIKGEDEWMFIHPPAPFIIRPNNNVPVTVTVRNWDTVPNMGEKNGVIDIESNDSNVSVSVTAYKPPCLREIPVLKGNINGDIDTFAEKEIIDLKDAILSLQVLTHHPDASSQIRNNYPESGADVNGDGKVGIQETIHILRHLGFSDDNDDAQD